MGVCVLLVGLLRLRRTEDPVCKSMHYVKIFFIWGTFCSEVCGVRKNKYLWNKPGQNANYLDKGKRNIIVNLILLRDKERKWID